MVITKQWVQEMVNEVRVEAEKEDWEVAHSKLDDVWESVLWGIANDKINDLHQCACLAIEAKELVKRRWYA